MPPRPRPAIAPAGPMGPPAAIWRGCERTWVAEVAVVHLVGQDDPQDPGGGVMGVGVRRDPDQFAWGWCGRPCP